MWSKGAEVWVLQVFRLPVRQLRTEVTTPQVLWNTQIFLEKQASQCTIVRAAGVQSGTPHPAKGGDPKAGAETGGEHDFRKVWTWPVEKVDVTDLKSWKSKGFLHVYEPH